MLHVHQRYLTSSHVNIETRDTYVHTKRAQSSFDYKKDPPPMTCLARGARLYPSQTLGGEIRIHRSARPSLSKRIEIRVDHENVPTIPPICPRQSQCCNKNDKYENIMMAPTHSAVNGSTILCSTHLRWSSRLGPVCLSVCRSQSSIGAAHAAPAALLATKEESIK